MKLKNKVVGHLYTDPSSVTKQYDIESDTELSGWHIVGDFWKFHFYISDASGDKIATISCGDNGEYNLAICDPDYSLASLLVALAVDANNALSNQTDFERALRRVGRRVFI